MLLVSWFFECNKVQWLKIKKEVINESCLAIYNFLCFALIVYIQPKRTRTSGARNVIREIPITVCIGKKSFTNNNCKFSGLAMLQPHQFFGAMFLFFMVGLIGQQEISEVIGITLLFSTVHLFALTMDEINETHSLHQLHSLIQSLF